MLVLCSRPGLYMNSQISLIEKIDALLPQTQCGLCGHRDGCLPYAKSISEGEDANKCIPGGQPVADAAALLNRAIMTAEARCMACSVRWSTSAHESRYTRR